MAVTAASLGVVALFVDQDQNPRVLQPGAAAAVITNRIEFVATNLYATELSGGASLLIRRTGDTNAFASVRLRTQGGTAVPDRDFMRPDQVVQFRPGQTEASAGIPIWDNPVTNTDRIVILELVEVTSGWVTRNPSATLTILDNDRLGHPGLGVAGAIRSAIQFGDGHVVLAGGFNNALGVPSFSIIRLTPMGVLDSPFQPGVGPDGWLNAVAAQNDGSLFVAGDFMRFSGADRGRCLRIGPLGQMDAQFRPVPGADGQITAVAIQSDGKLLITGDFLHVNGEACVRLARLHPDGTVDRTFQPGSGMEVRGSAMAVQSDGKILVCGLFNRFGETACSGLIRLNPDGSLDPAFRLSGEPSLGVETVVVAPNGQILIGGWFTRYFGKPRHLVARLQADGMPDESFRPDWDAHGSAEPAWNPNPHARHLSQLPDGRLLVSGGFVQVHGIRRCGLVRMHSDGRLDESFQHGPGTDNMANCAVSLPDGRVVVAGGFQHFDGFYSPGLAILDPDGRMPSATPHWIPWTHPEGGNDHSYALTSRPGTWDEAEREARQAGAHLVAIADAKEQAFLEVTFLRGVQKLRPLWIGLNDPGHGGRWEWSAGGRLRFANWAQGAPGGGTNGHCVAMNHVFSSENGTELALEGRWSAVPPDGSGQFRAAAGPYFGIMERVKP